MKEGIIKKKKTLTLHVEVAVEIRRPVAVEQSHSATGHFFIRVHQSVMFIVTVSILLIKKKPRSNDSERVYTWILRYEIIEREKERGKKNPNSSVTVLQLIHVCVHACEDACECVSSQSPSCLCRTPCWRWCRWTSWGAPRPPRPRCPGCCRTRSCRRRP